MVSGFRKVGKALGDVGGWVSESVQGWGGGKAAARGLFAPPTLDANSAEQASLLVRMGSVGRKTVHGNDIIRSLL